MEAKDLKNYNVPLTDMMDTIPMKTKLGLMKGVFKTMMSHMSLFDYARFVVLFTREKRRLAKVDLSSLAEKGLTNKSFIKQQVDTVAAYSAMAAMKGKDKALEIFFEIMGGAARKVYVGWMPSAEDVKKCDDPFTAFKQWYLAMSDVSVAVGGGAYEMVTNNKDVLHFTVPYCPWYEIARLLGIEEAALISCHADEVALPDYCREMGITYERKKALGQGDDCCDYMFGRIK